MKEEKKLYKILFNHLMKKNRKRCNMSFLEQYNEKLNYVWNYILKEECIKAFVRFYGKEYEYKIRNVIENLIIVWLKPNKKNNSKELIHECFENLKKEAKNILNQLNICCRNDDGVVNQVEGFIKKGNNFFENLIRETNGTVTLDDLLLLKKYWYQYQYYKELENHSNLLITGRNVDTSKYDSLISSCWDESFLGGTFLNLNECFLCAFSGYGINLGSLIHEINHLLSRELLAVNTEKGNTISHFGFLKNSYDFFYEVINDYITLDILQDINVRLGRDFDYLLKRDGYSTAYLNVDSVCLNFVQKVYYCAKDLISKSLIEGNGNKFVKVIGYDNYNNVNFLMTRIYDWMLRNKKRNPNLKEEDFRNKLNAKDLFKGYLSNIYKNVEEYNQYNKNLEQQLVEMEKNGTIQRL